MPPKLNVPAAWLSGLMLGAAVQAATPCPSCPLEGRVVALEADMHMREAWSDKHKEQIAALEAMSEGSRRLIKLDHERQNDMEARLQALELAIIADVAEIEKLKTLAEQGTDLFEEHDERLQALEWPAAPEPAAVSSTGAVSTASPTLDQQQRDTRPAAPAQRQPEWECDNCPYKGPPTVLWQCPYCKMEQEQPRQGAGL